MNNTTKKSQYSPKKLTRLKGVYTPFNSQQARSGFTLVETMIAIFILTMSISGALTIVTKGLSSAFFYRDQITAFYLAQGAIEHVRNRRDTNAIRGNPWLTDLDPQCTSGTPCRIDVRRLPPNDIVDCGGPCPALLYDGASGFYTYLTGDTTRFVREVRICDVNTCIVPVIDDEVIVTVDISWQTGLFSRSFTVKEHMFNWAQ